MMAKHHMHPVDLTQRPQIPERLMAVASTMGLKLISGLLTVYIVSKFKKNIAHGDSDV
jgi:hypothetical protein